MNENTTITVNVSDYLSTEEIKDICREEVKISVREQLKKEEDLQRFLTNSSYRFVWAAIEEKCPDNMLDLITAKISQIVNELAPYSVFRKKDAWDRDESKGWTLLQQALTESEPLIKKRVVELISMIDMYTIQDVINEQIQNVIDNLNKTETANA